ncbi:MAG: DUF4149 domain-containing protein [Gammaproteobacteria bacterium]|jgi:hypothetical protein|nr:DUF4149 domain-containing protein [Gammaproteobacteria bacterium]
MNWPLLLSWLLGALAGSMLFFATTVAPTVFRALPAEAAGTFLRRLFPRYYLWGLGLSVLCTIAAYFGTNMTAAIICALVASMFVYARLVLLPLINRARDHKLDGDPAAALAFRRLHLQSVLLNVLQLALLVGLGLVPDRSGGACYD